MSAYVCEPGDLSALSDVVWLSGTTEDGFSFGHQNELSCQDDHAGLAIGLENKAAKGIAIGFWSTANGEDCVAIGCGAKASGTGWANNVAVGRHAAVTGKSSVQLLLAPATPADRAEGRDYNVLSSDGTLRFRGTVVVGGDGKIPVSSLNQDDLRSLVRSVLDGMVQTA